MNLELSYLDLYKKKHTSSNYYFVSFRPISKGESFVSIFTKWVGHDKNYEIRSADIINVDATIRDFNVLNYPLAVINTEEELTAFLKVGGHSLILEHLVNNCWKEILARRIVVNTYERGYLEYNSLESKEKQRFAKGQFRMQIFERDNFQCRICGA